MRIFIYQGISAAGRNYPHMNNKRKAINYIIDLYEKKLPIDINTIKNKQILLTCACRYNDKKTVVDIINNIKIPLYFNKPLKVAFNYKNYDLCILTLIRGARISDSPFRYHKNWKFLKDMIDNGLQECDITERKWRSWINKFDLDSFKLYYEYDALYKVIGIYDIVDIIKSY